MAVENRRGVARISPQTERLVANSILRTVNREKVQRPYLARVIIVLAVLAYIILPDFFPFNPTDDILVALVGAMLFILQNYPRRSKNNH